MDIVVIRYKVRPEYVKQNRTNINAVMAYLRENPIKPLHFYWVTNTDNEQTFEHYAMADSKETIAKINSIEAFKRFRKELKDSDPILKPEQLKRTMIDNNFAQNQ